MLLTIFFDGYCPLCAEEMNQLRGFDSGKNLNFEDIHAADFTDRYPEIDVTRADQILHGRLFDGTMIYGLDVTVKAWMLVGQKKWLRVLRWPLIKWVADRVYLGFARNRYRISYWVTGKERCESCSIPQSLRP